MKAAEGLFEDCERNFSRSIIGSLLPFQNKRPVAPALWAERRAMWVGCDSRFADQQCSRSGVEGRIPVEVQREALGDWSAVRPVDAAESSRSWDAPAALHLLSIECRPGPRFMGALIRLRCQEKTSGGLCSPSGVIRQRYPAGTVTNSQEAIHDFSNTLELQRRNLPGLG